MGLFDAITASSSALTAERLRMDVSAENLANAQTTRGADGQPYRRKEVVLEQRGQTFGSMLTSALGVRGSATSTVSGVQVAAIVEDPAPNRLVYDPGHPDANPQGYVEMPNVNAVTEMVDLISAQRGYEANVTAIQTAKSMFSKTLDILR